MKKTIASAILITWLAVLLTVTIYKVALVMLYRRVRPQTSEAPGRDP